MKKITMRNLYRFDDEGIKEMANGIVQGTRYVYRMDDERHLRDSIQAALWVALSGGFSEAAARNLGAIVGNLADARMAMNGVPVTVAGWIVHKDDWAKVVDRIERVREAMDA